MLLTSARVRPCIALASESSPSRVTRIWSFSTFAFARRGISKSSLPLGPSTNTRRPLTSTFTLGGITTGIFPIRDITILNSLPDVTENFSADVLLARFGPAKDAARRGQNRNAHAAKHARNFCRPDITPQPRRADTLQTGDHAFAA